MKVENDSMHIYASEFDSLPFYWSSPFPVDTTANCRSLTLLSDEFYQTNGKPVEIKIYSESGLAVKTFKVETPVYGWNTARWTPGKDITNGFYNGIFKQDGIISSSKIIKY